MNLTDLTRLADQAAGVAGRSNTRLAELHDRIKVARRRRVAAATTSLVAAVLAIAAGISLAGGDSSRDLEPVGPTSPTETTRSPEGPNVRALVYASGRTIHIGDRTVDAGGNVVFIEPTDDGAAFVTSDLYAQPGAVPLWFTDGETTIRLGDTVGSPSRGYPVDAPESGSVITWGSEDTLIYNTRERRLFHQLPLPEEPLEATTDAYYWAAPDAECALMGDVGCVRWDRVVRFDLVSGDTETVDGDAYWAEALSRPRTLIAGFSGDAPIEGLVTYGGSIGFSRQGDRLVTRDRGVALEVLDARTRIPLALRVPSGYSASADYTIIQWLDDDQVALFGYYNSATEFADTGDILVCRLSTGGCHVAVRGSRSSGFEVPNAD